MWINALNPDSMMAPINTAKPMNLTLSYLMNIQIYGFCWTNRVQFFGIENENIKPIQSQGLQEYFGHQKSGFEESRWFDFHSSEK